MRRKALTVAALTAALPAATATAALHTQSFRSPSGKIRCQQFDGLLRCDQYGAYFAPPRVPKSCEFDYGPFGLRRTGRTHRLCVSDAVDARRVLRYGHSWSRGGVHCYLSRRGLKCRNRARHGFFTSRERQYTF